MALSEEIGFADRFVGEGEVKGRDRKNRKTKRDEKREEDTREMMHARELEESIERKLIVRIEARNYDTGMGAVTECKKKQA